MTFAHSSAALPNMAAFWNNLPYAKLEDDILTLPNGTSFLGYPDLGNALLVRPYWYPKMLSLLQHHFDKGGRAMVIVGTPGNYVTKNMISSKRLCLELSTSVYLQYSFTPHTQFALCIVIFSQTVCMMCG
jgi:hypothetical protein